MGKGKNAIKYIRKPRPLTGAFAQDNPPTLACPSGNLFLHLAFPGLAFLGKVFPGEVLPGIAP